MKKNISILLILAAGIFVVSVSSCRFNCVRGSGNKTSETRKVGEFTKIEISGAYKINLKQDSSSALTINGDDNLLKYIKTDISEGKLHIYNKRNICASGEIIVNVGIRDLKELEASGAVEVTSDGKITVKDIRFDVSGATKITMNLNAANVTTDGSGATRLNLTGQASTHNVDLSGAGKINALDFVVGDYNIETSGATKCEINVLNSLSIHSSGASSVRYRGNPKTINNDKSGASSVKQVD